MNIDELITKYLTNESSADENAALLEWVISDESHKKDFIATCQIWHSSAHIHSKFDITNAYKVFQDSTQKLEARKNNKIRPLWKAVSAIAAVAILTVGIFFLVNYQNSEIISVAHTEIGTKTIVLPDGSLITLNQGAIIEYPKEFSKSKRSIELSGKAFCNITPNPSAPFIISSSDMHIEVLGTSFEIETNSHVIVETGKIKTTYHATNEFVILEKGERADISNNSLRKSSNEDINYLSWKHGTLTFENTSLDHVFSDLERHFKYKFIVNHNSVYQHKFTGTYQNASLEEIIEILHLAFPSLQFLQSQDTILVKK